MNRQQTLKLSKIKSNPENPRIIKDDKFKKLVQSLKDFPVMTELREVLLDENDVIIGGNMRYKASKEAGWTEISVKYFTREDAERNNTLTEQNKTYEEYVKELVIKDNISGGEWDWDMIANQYDPLELDAWGLDLPDKSILEPEIEEDEVPEVKSEPPVSQLGSIYQLGKHRVMCGDSTDKASVELLMNGNKADMVFTDPPYNVNLKYEDYEDNKSQEDYSNMIKSFVENGLQFTKTMVITPGKSNKHYYYKLFDIKDSMVWYKKFGLSRGSLYKAMVTEPILFIGEKPLNKNFKTDLLEYMTDKVDGLKHACPKPVALIADIVAVLTDKSTITLDLFLGSGSTLIACEQTDRICYGMELDPKYVDVIRKRYAKYCYPDTWEERWEELTPAI